LVLNEFRNIVPNDTPVDTVEKILLSLSDSDGKRNDSGQRLYKAVGIGSVKACRLPLSVVIDLLHQRFSKQKFLESTLEMLQQFIITMDKFNSGYNVFPGDKNMFYLTCARCGKRASPICNIGTLLSVAPSAMLWHWGFVDVEQREGEPRVYRSSIPLLYGSDDSYQRSLMKFRTDILRDKENLYLENNTFPCNKYRHGEYMFCEAAKVDMNNVLEAKDPKAHQSTILSTVDLITVLFDDLWPGLQILNQINCDKSKMKFNDSFGNKTYSFGKAAIFDKSLDPMELHSLKIIETWCMFFHRDCNMNRLHIYQEITKYIYHMNSIPYTAGYFLPALSPDVAFDYGDMHQDICVKQKKWADFPFVYFCQLDKNDYYIIGKSCRPVQFQIGQMSTMSSIYQTKGSGWSKVNTKQYFMPPTNLNNSDIPEKLMTTAKEYELAYLMLSTMDSIRMSVPKPGYKKFEILCQTGDYQKANTMIRVRHPGFFRKDKYIFQPNDDLIMTLPFKWIDSLKDGEWTKLDKSWLTKINGNLNQAAKNAVKSVKLIRSLGNTDHPDIWTAHEHNDKDIYSREYIYKVFLSNSEFYVFDNQIGDIIGEETWLGGEWFSLSNIASGRMVALSIGAKKRPALTMLLLKNRNVTLLLAKWWRLLIMGRLGNISLLL